MNPAERLVRAYYEAFNAGDRAALVALLTEDVVHDVSQGERQCGRDAFAAFMAHMDRSYRERVSDVVVMTEPGLARAAAEFTVHGSYFADDPGVPPRTAAAHGQSYTLEAGAFFTLRDGLIARVANHYNLGEWIRQISV